MHVPAISPHDKLSVLLEAFKIPDGSTVTKRTGEKQYILRHNIKVYPVEEKGSDRTPMVINGFFLCDDAGHFTQIKSDTDLLWIVTAQVLMWSLQTRFEDAEDK